MFRKLLGACVGLAMMGMAGAANATLILDAIDRGSYRCGRMDRLEATLGDDDLESWRDWINKRLTPEEAAKVLHEAVR